MKLNFIRPLGIAAILLLCAGFSCRTKKKADIKKEEKFVATGYDKYGQKVTVGNTHWFIPACDTCKVVVGY